MARLPSPVRATIVVLGLALGLLLGSCAEEAAPTPTPTPTVTPTRLAPTPTPTPFPGKPSPTPTSPPSPSPMPASEVRAWLSAPRDPIRPGDAIELIVFVAPGSFGISSGEATISFDANVFEVVDVVPGSLLGSQPLVGFKQIDNSRGEIKVAVARVGTTQVPSPEETLVLAKLLARQSAPEGESRFNLHLALADHEFKSVAMVADGGSVIVVR